MLVVLEVVVGSEVGRQIKIPQDRTCKIGRTNYSDEAFTDDVMMSGQHFEIRNDGKYCWLRDLESRNGTRVDDDFVKESLVIRDGQKVFAGRTEFMVKIDGGAKNPYESTNIGMIEPVKNRSLMSTTFGSEEDVAEDSRFPRSGSGGRPQTPLPPGTPQAPTGPPLPPGTPAPTASGNIEFPPSGSFPSPEFPKSHPSTAAEHSPGFPPPGEPPQGTSKSPPWARPSANPVTPGQPLPGQITPAQLPPGTPPGDASQFSPPPKRGGDEGPVFRFAKGGSAPSGPPPGLPPTFRHTPGTPPGMPPGTPPGTSPPRDPRFETPPTPSDPPSISGHPPTFEAPGQPPQEPPESFSPPPGKPLPSGTPPDSAPSSFHNFDEPSEPPSFSSFASPLPPQDSENKLGPPGSLNPPPWEAAGGFGGGKNPNLDFGSDEYGPNIGPSLDFGDEIDDDEEPLFGPSSYADVEGPSSIEQRSPESVNPDLVGFSPDEPSSDQSAAVPNDNPPVAPSSGPANVIEPTSPAPVSNWRNPDYVAAARPTTSDQNVDKAAPPAPDSVRGLCFREETADSGYPVYHSIIEGVPKVPFSPFALIKELSKVAKPVLSIHFMRAEKQIPEHLEGTPLRADLDSKFAALGGPMLYCPEDLEPFREIIDQLWGHDAISCLFTSGEPQAIINHFREGLFAPKRGDLPSQGPGPQFFAVFSPNLLTTFLSQRDQDTVDELMGTQVTGVLAEVADMPESWQLFTKQSWAESLKKLGMNRVVEQPQ